MGGSNAGYNAIANSPAVDKMKFDGGSIPQQQTIPSNLTESQNAERIQKQGMSDQGIVSLGELKKEAVGTWNDLRSAVQSKINPSVTPNSYGRETSRSEAAIEEGLK